MSGKIPTKNKVSSSSATVVEIEKRHRSLLIPTSIVIFILLVIFLVVLAYIKSDSRKINKLPKSYSSQQKIDVLIDQGDYTAAQKVLDQKVVAATTKTEKLGAIYMKSSLALQFKKYRDATKYADQSRDIDQNSPTPYVAYANIATAQKQNDQAVRYWQLAISKLDPTSPSYQLKKHDYEASIKALQ